MGCQFMPQSYAAPKSISWLLAVFIMLLSETAFPAKIVELSVQGGIGPATADYLIRGIDKAQGAELIILKIDTPGGLDKSMRQIVKSILTSETPVVVYVAPSGARAASAGTYLLYAGTLAAMAPGTHLGAASPVSIGGGMGEDAKDKQSVMNQKITQDAVAYIRTLAQLRGRDPDFAEKAVLNAETLTADEALRKKVINYIADNRQHLLSQLHGVTVVQDGRQVKLNTRNANVVDLKPDWRMRFLLVITDPTIAYLLLLLGIYGIFFELMNPGFIAPWRDRRNRNAACFICAATPAGQLCWFRLDLAWRYFYRGGSICAKFWRTGIWRHRCFSCGLHTAY